MTEVITVEIPDAGQVVDRVDTVVHDLYTEVMPRATLLQQTAIEPNEVTSSNHAYQRVMEAIKALEVASNHLVILDGIQREYIESIDD